MSNWGSFHYGQTGYRGGRSDNSVGGHIRLPGDHIVHGDHSKAHFPGAGNIHSTNVGVTGPVAGGTYSVEASKTSGMGMPVQRSVGAAFEKTANNGVTYKVEAGRNPQSGNYGIGSVSIPF